MAWSVQLEMQLLYGGRNAESLALQLLSESNPVGMKFSLRNPQNKLRLLISAKHGISLRVGRSSERYHMSHAIFSIGVGFGRRQIACVILSDVARGRGERVHPSFPPFCSLPRSLRLSENAGEERRRKTADVIYNQTSLSQMPRLEPEQPTARE